MIEAGKKSGVEIRPIHYSELVMKKVEGEVVLEAQGKDLIGAGLFCFRSVGDKNEWLPILLEYAKEKGIVVVDKYLLGMGGSMRKRKGMEAYLLMKAGVAYADTKYSVNKKDIVKWVKEKGEVVVKSSSGRHGIGTFLVKKGDDIERLLFGRGGGFLVQEYIPNDGDWRVFAIGGEIAGSFKRGEKDTGRVALNRSMGQSEAKEAPEEVRVLVRKAIEVLGVEVAGVDVVMDERSGKPVIIEVNQAPEFEIMEKRTGIDMGKKIVEYLLKKMG